MLNNDDVFIIGSRGNISILKNDLYYGNIVKYAGDIAYSCGMRVLLKDQLTHAKKQGPRFILKALPKTRERNYKGPVCKIIDPETEKGYSVASIAELREILSGSKEIVR